MLVLLLKARRLLLAKQIIHIFMHQFLSTALHLFVIAAIAAFIVGGVSALAGTYDHWGSRYILKARRSRLIRERAKANNTPVVLTMVPYKFEKLNRKAIFYNRVQLSGMVALFILAWSKQ